MSTTPSQRSKTKPRAPTGLEAAGRSLWRRIVADLQDGREFEARELEVLEQACLLADHLAAVQAVVKRRGVTATGSKGQPVVNPFVVEARQQRLVMLRLLSALGLEEEAAESASPKSLRAQRAANARPKRRGQVRDIREAS